MRCRTWICASSPPDGISDSGGQHGASRDWCRFDQMLFGTYFSALATCCAALTGSSSSATCVAQYQSPAPRRISSCPVRVKEIAWRVPWPSNQAFQFREEFEQIFARVHSSPFKAGTVLSTSQGSRGWDGSSRVNRNVMHLAAALVGTFPRLRTEVSSRCFR